MTLPTLYPHGYLCRPITFKNCPAGVTSLGAAPPLLADSALRKRADERLCMGAESATVLNCKWDQGVPSPMDPGSMLLRDLVGVEFPVLYQLGCIPRNLPCLPLPSVHVGSCNYPIQYKVSSGGVVVQHHNVARS